MKPKTWKKLVEVLSEVDELEEVIGEIKQGLISEGVSFDGMYMCVRVVYMYVCMTMQGYIHNTIGSSRGNIIHSLNAPMFVYVHKMYIHYL